MNKIKPISFIFTGLVSVLLYSVQQVPTIEELIEAEVEKKIVTLTTIEKNKCRQKVLDQASLLVDSLLIARAKLQVKESSEKPEIPFRPDRPEVKVPKDTTAIVPIFPSGRVDAMMAKDSAISPKRPGLPIIKKRATPDVDSLDIKQED